MISTLLQFPLVTFLVLDKNLANSIIEKVFNIIALIFLVVEIITGTYVLKKSADHHAKRFYMAQMYGIDDTINK